MFTGRTIELTMLHEHVQSGNAAAITAVQCMGWIGRRSLAREADQAKTAKAVCDWLGRQPDSGAGYL